MNNSKDIYQHRPGIIAREIVGEFILVPVSEELASMHSFFTLNSVGRFIWEHLDGTNTLETVAKGITETFEVSPETAKEDLNQLIDELRMTGLIILVTQEEVL